MLQSINGICTRHYGRSAEADDGSYVTTVWFTILFVPIVPLRSERILPLSRYDGGYGGTRFRYAMVGRVPLDWPEIRRVVITGWSMLAWWASLIVVYDEVSDVLGEGNGYWVAITWLALPIAVLFSWEKWLRAPAKLRPIQTTPGSEFSVYRRSDPVRGEKETNH